MKSCNIPLLLSVFVLIILYSFSAVAENVYYTSEGLKIKKYSVPKPPDKVNEPPITKKTQPVSTKTDQKLVLNKKAPTPAKPAIKKSWDYITPTEASEKGYNVGQTVMEKDGIIYKLAKDSKTGKFKYKRYRKVKKKKGNVTLKATPSEAADAGYKIGQTVMVRNGIIYKLARNPKNGKYIYKRYRKAKPKPKPEIKKSELPEPAPSKPESVKAEQTSTVIKEEPKTETKKTEAVQPKSDAESMKEKTEPEVNESSSVQVKTEDRVEDKTRSDIVQEDKGQRQRERQESRSHSLDEPVKMNGRNMGRFKMAVAFRHSFLDRKTSATKRTLMQGATTTDEELGDSFFTDMHCDSIRFRLGLTDNVEMYLDAGFAYDKVSDIADMEPVFGLGLRYNFKTIETGLFSGTYFAFSSELMKGKLSSEFSASNGSSYSHENDWQDITATIESGIVLSKLTFYSGISYMLYSESMQTEEIQPNPGNSLLEEELEQHTSLNLTVGVEYRYSSNLNFQLEAQLPNRQGAIIGVEYRF